MTFLLFLGVCAAGGLGAACRMAADGVLKAALGTRFPWATGIINVTGSFLLGLVAGLAAARAVPPGVQAVLGTGFLGGYTTFSTAAVETYRLVQERRWGAAAANLFGVLLAGCLAAAVGLWLGQNL